jgi:hypothetical protein
MEIKKMLFVTDFEGLWFDALRSLMALRAVGLDHVRGKNEAQGNG